MDVTFSTKCGGRQAFRILCSEVLSIQMYLHTSDLETDVQMSSDIESSPGKEGVHMLTIEGLIAALSLVLTAFGLGYAIGRNHSNTRE